MTEVNERESGFRSLVEWLVVTQDQMELSGFLRESFPAFMKSLQYGSVFDVIREARSLFIRKLVDSWKCGDKFLAPQAYDKAACYVAQESLVHRQQWLSTGRYL